VSVPVKMRAVVAYAPHDFRLEEVDVPVPGPGEVLVKVEACGICSSDVKAFKGAESYWGGASMAPWVKAPFIPGHEFVGHVAALGDGAGELHHVAVGDRVIADQIVPCGACRYCRRGQYWMCEVHNVFGFQTVVHGAWAEYMKFPRESLVHKIPPELAVELAVLTEPVSCAVHAVERGRIEFGDVVVVSGAGPIGLAMVGLARLKGPRAVVSLDLDERRLELARSFGANVAINPTKEDAVAAVKAMTDGYGCDVYIETAGHPSSIGQGLAMVRKLGRFVEFSVFGEPATIDWSLLGEKKELDVYGSHLGPYSYPVAIDFLNRGLIRMDGVVTHQLPLDQWEEALHLVAAGTESIKVVLRP
jgi:2-desacetyl-2-hydroxyethyl bacteriochlorophyllide A dehydrogenase